MITVKDFYMIGNCKTDSKDVSGTQANVGFSNANNDSSVQTIKRYSQPSEVSSNQMCANQDRTVIGR